MVAAASAEAVEHPFFFAHAPRGIKKFVGTTTSLRFAASTLAENREKMQDDMVCKDQNIWSYMELHGPVVWECGCELWAKHCASHLS